VPLPHEDPGNPPPAPVLPAGPRLSMTQDISVVIPAYLADDYGNAPRYLRRALQSVFDQEQRLREIIVVFGPAHARVSPVRHVRA